MCAFLTTDPFSATLLTGALETATQVAGATTGLLQAGSTIRDQVRQAINTPKRPISSYHDQSARKRQRLFKHRSRHSNMARYRRRRRRRFRRRRSRRRFSRKRRSRSKLKLHSPFPQSVVKVFKYHQKGVLTATAAATPSGLVFRINGPTDPFVTSLGTHTQSPGHARPKYWTKWQPFYDRYFCYKASIDVMVNSRGTESDESLIIGIAETEESAVFVDTQTAYEDRSCKKRYGTVPTLSASSFKMHSRPGSVHSEKAKIGPDGTQYTGTTDGLTLPVKQSFWHLFMHPFQNGHTPQMEYQVRITYFCKLFDPAEDREDDIET